jgi:hypothetical protein
MDPRALAAVAVLMLVFVILPRIQEADLTFLAICGVMTVVIAHIWGKWE